MFDLTVQQDNKKGACSSKAGRGHSAPEAGGDHHFGEYAKMYAK